MPTIAASRRWLRRWLRRRNAEARLSVRMTAAGFLAFALAHLVGLSQGFWAVITAVIVIQSSVGGSLKAALDRLVGSLSGAAWGTAVALLVPHADLVALGAAVIVAIAPPAVLAAMVPSFRVAPVTAAIVLLGAGANDVGLIASAIDRVLEITLGSLVGMTVSIFVVPARAHRVLTGSANRTLRLLAQLMSTLCGCLTGGAKADRVQRLLDTTRLAIGRIETIGSEAARERAIRLTEGPDPEPLVRTLTRIRNDLVMVSRTAAEPLTEPALGLLRPVIDRIMESTVRFMTEIGEALARRGPPPARADVEAAFDAYAAALAEMRRLRVTGDMSAEIVGRIFALGFIFEQLRRNFADLSRRAEDFARRDPTVRKDVSTPGMG